MTETTEDALRQFNFLFAHGKTAALDCHRESSELACVTADADGVLAPALNCAWIRVAACSAEKIFFLDKI